MDINPNVIMLQNYLKNNGVIIHNDAPGEHGAETSIKLIEYMEKLKREARSSQARLVYYQSLSELDYIPNNQV
jgi:hypothetical protein